MSESYEPIDVLAVIDEHKHIVYEGWTDHSVACSICGRPAHRFRRIYLSRPEGSPDRIVDDPPDCHVCSGLRERVLTGMRDSGDFDDSFQNPDFLQFLEHRYGPIAEWWSLIEKPSLGSDC